MSNLFKQFTGGAGGQFRIAPLDNPFENAKSILSYRQKSIPFWVNMLFGLAGLTFIVVIAILELVSLFTSGFKLGGFGTTLAPKFPGDSQTYALFALVIPLFGMAALALVAAFIGRAVFGDGWIQWIYAGIQTLLFVLGFVGVVIVMIVACGRLNSCLNKDKGTPFCHDEKGDLIATIVMTALLLFNSLPILAIALLGLFWRNLQLMAIGMDSKNRSVVVGMKKPADQNKAIKMWQESKTIEEATPAAKDQSLFPDSNVSASSAGRPSAPHAAAARAILASGNKFQ